MKSSSASFAFLVSLSMIGLVTQAACQYSTYNRQRNERQWQQLASTTESQPSAVAWTDGQAEAEPTSQQTDSRPLRKQNGEVRKLQRELRTLRYQVTQKERELEDKIGQMVRRASEVEQLNTDLGTTVDTKNEEIRRLKEQQAAGSRNCVRDRGHGYVVDDELHADCKHPEDSGDCRGDFPRYFYDGRTRNCREFVWGGCNGNPNNFESLAECERKCGRG